MECTIKKYICVKRVIIYNDAPEYRVVREYSATVDDETCGYNAAINNTRV